MSIHFISLFTLSERLLRLPCIFCSPMHRRASEVSFCLLGVSLLILPCISAFPSHEPCLSEVVPTVSPAEL